MIVIRRVRFVVRCLRCIDACCALSSVCCLLFVVVCGRLLPDVWFLVLSADRTLFV